MGKYEIGEVWWVHFPFSDEDKEKRRPAIVIDDDTIAILAMYVTSKNKTENPYSIEIEDWKEAGLAKPSWTRIDRIVEIQEWYMDRKIGELSEHDLKKIMQLVAEITTGTLHEFSLIAITNPEEKYLLKYDERWKCWLFPYVRSEDNNLENVEAYIEELLKIELPVEYVAVAKHCKYSVSDEVYKIYNHKLYRAKMYTIPEGMQNETFQIGEKQYRWMSIEEMKQDDCIMKENDDVVAFVKVKCH